MKFHWLATRFIVQLADAQNILKYSENIPELELNNSFNCRMRRKKSFGKQNWEWEITQRGKLDINRIVA